MEEWKDIQGYEGMYQISSMGRVKGLDREKKSRNGGVQFVAGKVLKTRIKNNGYVQVKLSKGAKFSHLSVHRLVAKHFLPNPNMLPEVNHKDGDKENNSSTNLEWVSSSFNQKHAFRLGLQKARRGDDSQCSKPVLQIDLNGQVVRRWASIKGIKREAGYNTYGIIKCCKKEKRYKTAYGYKWEYEKGQGG